MHAKPAPPARQDTVSPAGPGDAAALSELRRLAGPLFSVLESSPLAMMATDPRLPNNPIVFANAACARLTGYDAGELLTRRCQILAGPLTDAASAAEFDGALDAGHELSIKILHYRKDGTTFWNELVISQVRDESGEIAFNLLLQRDVTAACNACAVVADQGIRQDRLQRINDGLQTALAISRVTATWEWDIRHHRIIGDAGFAALVGVSAADAASGLPPNAFFANIHPEDRDRIRIAVGGILRGAEVFAKSYRLILDGVSVRWVLARGHCAYDEQQRPARFNGILVDITEQKRLEEQLRIAQSAGGVGTFEHVAGFATVSVAPQFCNLVGLRPATDLPVRTINKVVHPDDPPIIDYENHGTAAAGRVEFRIIRPDNGELRWLVRQGEHMQDSDTGGTRFSGVIYDITEQKRSEARLLSLNETLEARIAEQARERARMWNVSHELMGVAAADGTWISISPSWTKQLGWTSGDIVGKSFAWLQHPEDPQVVWQPDMAVDTSGFAFETRLRTRDGQFRWISWTAVPEAGQNYCVGRDVTEQKEAESALREAEEKLRHSQKMEAVGQLTGGIAHDFNNMLQGIISGIALARRRFTAGRLDDVPQFLEAATAEAQRAAVLTGRLLAFGRRQPLNPRAVAVDVLLRSLEGLITRTVGPAIDVVLDIQDAIWPVTCDANQLESALLNLAINARDAMMPQGGRLILRAVNSVLGEADTKEWEGVRPGDFVHLTATDTGVGMPAQVLAHAFDPFFTTKPDGQGTGLGLSQIYGFVRQSGAIVRLQSVVGAGTVVHLFLPRAASMMEAVSEKAALAPLSQLPAGAAATVLLVDDEPAIRRYIAVELREAGYHVIEARNGIEGLEMLRANAMPVHMLVSDIGLPGGLNGRQLADAARALLPDLPVLLITGYAGDALEGDRRLTEGMDLLRKPFEPVELLDRVRAMMFARK